jgi:archaemetzincin
LLPAFLILAAGATKRRVIAVAPVGDTPPEAVSLLLPMLRETFGAEVVIAPAVPLPSPAYDRRRRQHLSTALLDALAQARRPGWDRLLGVADVDLFVPELNFVFGEGDPNRGVAVFSLQRLRAEGEAPGRELLARRAATEAIHELGHSYGLGHCHDRHCVMWFSNSLAETDRKGTRFCPAHAAELRRLMARPVDPCSTFKIFNSLAGLQSRVLEDETTMFA